MPVLERLARPLAAFVVVRRQLAVAEQQRELSERQAAQGEEVLRTQRMGQQTLQRSEG